MLSTAGTLLARGLPRTGVGNVGTTAARGIHTSPSSFSRPTSQVSIWYRQLSNARTKVTRFISQAIHQPIAQAQATISTSAFNANGQSAIRHNAATSIKQSLSFPTRMTLSRPLSVPHHLPRPPPVPRCMTQVGLGTARNFSTSRPIFQNLVQNVPVAGRAFCEIDWDLRMERNKLADRVVRANKAKGKKTIKAGPAIKPIRETKKENIPVEQDTSCTAADLEHYYPEAPKPAVTTYVRIPLAPTPTERVPLSSTSSEFPLLLPLPAMSRIYVTHANHSQRVAALFRKLDDAHVWTRGAKMEGWGHPSGLCTVMLITFAGWTEEMVREVIGVEDGQWVAIEEIEDSPPSKATSDYGSGMDSLFSSALSSPVFRPVELPALPPPAPLDLGAPSLHDSVPASGMEFVMPSIDFSSSFLSDHASFAGDWDSDEDSRSSHSADDFHHFSDDEVQSVASDDDVQSVATHVTNTNSLGWSTLSFSSDFVHRTALEQFSTF